MAGVNVDRSRAAALRAEALMDFPDLIFDDRFRNLLRKSEKGAASLAFLVAEAAVGVAFAAEEDRAGAVSAFGHGSRLEYRWMEAKDTEGHDASNKD